MNENLNDSKYPISFGPYRKKYQRKNKNNSTKEEKPKGKPSTPETRREYQRRYYQMHKEKAKEYARGYNLIHKKKARRSKKKTNFLCPREATKSIFNAFDICASTVFIEIFNFLATSAYFISSKRLSIKIFLHLEGKESITILMVFSNSASTNLSEFSQFELGFIFSISTFPLSNFLLSLI